MIKVFKTTIFLLLILFSCSKSLESQIIGHWKQSDWSQESTMFINKDKTYATHYSSSGELIASGFWTLHESTMELCLDNRCALITSIEKNKFCVNVDGEHGCLYRIK